MVTAARKMLGDSPTVQQDSCDLGEELDGSKKVEPSGQNVAHRVISIRKLFVDHMHNKETRC